MAATHEEITERLQKATLACHPLLCRLKEIGHARSFGGGRTIVQEIEYPVLVEPDFHRGFNWYSGYSSLRHSGYKPANYLHKIGTEVIENCFTAAEYHIKQAAITIIEGSADPEIDPIEEAIKGASKMISQTISVGGLRDSINSLPDLVSATPTVGTIGGIDRQKHKFWRNLSVSYRAGSLSAKDAINLMMAKLLISYEGSSLVEWPDLILMGKDDFEYFKACMGEKALMSRYSGWGFESFDMNGSSFVLDPGIEASIENYAIMPPKIYFLHTRFFYWRTHELRNWKKLDADRFYKESIKQQPLPDLYGWAGNLTMNCSYAQGVLYRVS